MLGLHYRKRARHIHLCGDSNIDDIPWGTTHRNIQTLMTCLNRQVPTIQELVDFFMPPHEGSLEASSRGQEALEPHDIGVWLLCIHGITSKCVLLSPARAPAAAVTTPRNPSKRTTRQTYTTYPNEELGFDIFMERVSNSSCPVIIHNGEQSYIILEMIYNNKNKNNASLRIGDALNSSCENTNIPWVSAKRFLSEKSETQSWMCIFIDHHH